MRIDKKEYYCIKCKSRRSLYDNELYCDCGPKWELILDKVIKVKDKKLEDDLVNGY